MLNDTISRVSKGGGQRPFGHAQALIQTQRLQALKKLTIAPLALPATDQTFSDRLKSPANTHASRGPSFICTMLDHPRRLALHERCERLLRQHSPHGQREALRRLYSAALRAAE